MLSKAQRRMQSAIAIGVLLSGPGIDAASAAQARSATPPQSAALPNGLPEPAPSLAATFLGRTDYQGNCAFEGSDERVIVVYVESVSAGRQRWTRVGGCSSRQGNYPSFAVQAK